MCVKKKKTKRNSFNSVIAVIKTIRVHMYHIFIIHDVIRYQFGLLIENPKSQLNFVMQLKIKQPCERQK